METFCFFVFVVSFSAVAVGIVGIVGGHGSISSVVVVDVVFIGELALTRQHGVMIDAAAAAAPQTRRAPERPERWRYVCAAYSACCGALCEVRCESVFRACE